MPDLDNPFTEEQFADLEKGLVEAGAAIKAIEKAQRAGIELPGQLDLARDTQRRITQILQTYRPNR